MLKKGLIKRIIMLNIRADVMKCSLVGLGTVLIMVTLVFLVIMFVVGSLRIIVVVKEWRRV